MNPAVSEAQACAHGRTSPDNGQPVPSIFMGNRYFGPSAMTVTVYVDDATRSSGHWNQETFNQGITKWSQACGTRPDVPNFQLNWTGTRPPVQVGNSADMNLRTTMLVQFGDKPAPSIGLDTYELASYDLRSNTITLAGRCPDATAAGLPCDGPGLPIRWSTPGLLEGVLAHELGHGLGLGHDSSSGACGGGIMLPITAPGNQIRPEHCALADRLNNAEHLCHGTTAAAGEEHPCDTSAGDLRSGWPGGPRGDGSGLEDLYCQEYPWLCRNGAPWRGSGIHCDWVCTAIQIEFGDTWSNCAWRCGGGPIPTDPNAPETGPVSGVAPWVGVKFPDRNAVLSGVVTLAGFAVDLAGPSAVSFGLDGTELAVTQFSYGFLDGAACSPPMGHPSPACNPRSGFSARFDTRLVPNGPHTLQVLASDVNGWTTSIEVPIVIDNQGCADTTSPTVSITSPAANATVLGATNVTASAADNVGVTEVRFFVDGAWISTDRTSPFVFPWDTGTVTPGGHSLSAKAYDACSNVRTSTAVPVTVTRPADIAVSRAVDGVAVARGSSVGLPGTTPGVSTSTRFRIVNEGVEPLALGNPSGLVSGTCFHLIETPTSSIPAGGEAFFRVRLLCDQAGAFTGSVSILSNDPDENPYSFQVTGVVTALNPPDIVVTRAHDGTEVPRGASTSIGTAPVGAAASVRFRVGNVGTGDLVLSNPTAILSGPCFYLIETPAASVPPGGETFFRVRLLCGAVGSYAGTVSIATNDGDEAPYAFTVTGTVTP